MDEKEALEKNSETTRYKSVHMWSTQRGGEVGRKKQNDLGRGLWWDYNLKEEGWEKVIFCRIIKLLNRDFKPSSPPPTWLMTGKQKQTWQHKIMIAHVTTCSLVVLPLATRTTWKPVRPATGMKKSPATHMTAILIKSQGGKCEAQYKL